MKYENGETHFRKRNRLPHLDIESGIQFVTFNLFDALPVDARIRIASEANAQLSVIEHSRGSLTQADIAAVSAWKRRQIQGVLDRSSGSCLLRDERAAEVVHNAILYLDKRKYDLGSWSVMPNHVHLVYGVRDFTCADVMQSLKGFTSHEVNKVLGRKGTLWQSDYLDRSIRDDDELRKVVRYIANNPAAAGLVQWRFSGVLSENLAKMI